MNPFRYRPPQGDDSFWDDNALSNVLAWLSKVVTPRWCQSPDHWTARLADRLFTDCPCCLLFRGAALGAAVALPAGLLIGKLL